MKNISFSMTTEQVRRREKTVTRRLGWWGLRPGTLLQAVEKAQGLKKGEHVVPICVIRVVKVKTERLYGIRTVYTLFGGDGRDETAREGFPGLTPDQFVDMFCKANRCQPGTFVNRIEFEYVP